MGINDKQSTEKDLGGAALTCGSCGAVGAHHLLSLQHHGAGGAGRAGAGLAVVRGPASGVAVETIPAALAAQAGRVVLAVARS